MSPAESAHWKKLGKIIEQDGNLGEQAMYRLHPHWISTTPFVRNAMLWHLLILSSKLWLKAELKARAFEAAWNESNGRSLKTFCVARS